MKETRTVEQEAAEDIFFGQVVINWARWFLIAGGIVLVLWKASDINQLVVGTLAVVALMAVNFYLHGRQLAERPANPALITVASLLDLAVITVVILVWPESEHRGLASPFFIFYYPMVLAFAFVMPPKSTAAYTLVALAAYAGACFLASPSIVTDTAVAANFDVETLVARLITLGAVGGLGTYYWRIQRNRRRATMGQPPTMNEPQPDLQA